jgi:hypothetical protein
MSIPIMYFMFTLVEKTGLEQELVVEFELLNDKAEKAIRDGMNIS